MVWDEELVRLAHLLRLSSETARSIAGARQADAAEICAAADKAIESAALLEKIARTSFDACSKTEKAGGRLC